MSRFPLFQDKSRLFPRRLAPLVFAAALSATGCTYKSEIRQGNDMLPEQLEKLEIGMSRDEVLNLMGATLTPPLYTGDDLIYFYRHRSPGFITNTTTWSVELIFEDGALAEVRKLIYPVPLNQLITERQFPPEGDTADSGDAPDAPDALDDSQTDQ